MKNTVNKYFEVKVKMQKTQEDGTQKKVSEQYVVEAATFGEAERRISPISRVSLMLPTSR